MWTNSYNIEILLGQSTDCSDALTPEGYDPFAYATNEVWHHDKIFRSKLACQSNRKMGMFEIRNLYF